MANRNSSNKKQEKLLKGTRALVMGIGLHGGGAATIKWLVGEGAKVTATDMRAQEALASSLLKLKKLPVSYTLGEHKKKDFESADLVVVNPAVKRESEYVAIAKNRGARIENDTSLFFEYDTHAKIAVTGTRGKTTATAFIAALLQKKYPRTLPSGNTPENALLAEFYRIKGDSNTPVVCELSSWQLEYLPSVKKAPHIALITNLFPDHLNRYKNINAYADAKANIFLNQHEDDFLVLNKDSSWTKYFLAKRPQSTVFFISKKPLRGNENGIYVKNGILIFRADNIEQKLFSVLKFTEKYGGHNLENLMGAVLAVKLFDPTLQVSAKDILQLTLPRMRQQEVYKKGRVQVINDSCATSPDGTIAAIRRFTQLGRKAPHMVLITGGTDKELEFGELAKTIKKHIPFGQLILLEGSATVKLEKQFKIQKSKIKKFRTLGECVSAASEIAQQTRGKTIILFSPGAASFEKFLHEFDRGEQFNKLVKKYFK